MRVIIISILFLVVSCKAVKDPDPLRFKDDISAFKTLQTPKDVVVFTGSSSMRFWNDLPTDCSDILTVNTGFGGSQMSDLLYYLDDAVLRFKSSTVYIYEGDNDINAGKSPRRILQTTKKVTRKLLDANPNTKIYYISAKPSPSRWQYKTAYENFNKLLQQYCNSKSQLEYIDVWTPMLNTQGKPLPHIFIKDSLHMNRKGYEIWKAVICNK